jgi:hypothetical protein
MDAALICAAPAIAIAAAKVFTRQTEFAPTESPEQGPGDTSSKDENAKQDAAAAAAATAAPLSARSQNDKDTAKADQEVEPASDDTADRRLSDDPKLASGAEEAPSREEGVVSSMDGESASKEADESMKAGLNGLPDENKEKLLDGEGAERPEESGVQDDAAEKGAEAEDSTRKDFVAAMLQVLLENKGNVHELDQRIAELQGLLTESDKAVQGAQETFVSTTTVMEQLVVKLAEAKAWREGEDARMVQQVSEALAQQLKVRCLPFCVCVCACPFVCVCVCMPFFLNFILCGF